ncbi:MAG: alkyl hydroperoxide reductase, partial [Planctomycetaceae bacterium]|nr:alkyl hydroperoxide reductase [Planctomycetaceae bacterium]
VAPIIVENCAGCHREGGIGPFAMNSHLMLQGWSPMIREVLMTKRMPPMQVDPNIGHFENANYISGDDLQTLITWIDAGSPKGVFAEDPLSKLQFADAKSWQLGEPDFVVKTPRQEIPATGVMDYINVDVDLPFTEDKWVRAVQFIPGDETVLHHLLTYVTAPSENFDGGEADQRSVARRFLEGYAPGKVDAMVFPEDTGVLIPAGHKLSMQFHFTTNGRATSDETTLGMYFYDEKPAHENFTRSVSTMFVIPPHASNHEVHASYVFNDEVVVNGLRAHMHFRGKAFELSAERNGEFEPLLKVPHYDFNWQHGYELETPLPLSDITDLHFKVTFDNSEDNPFNPNPAESVTWGDQTWEEMAVVFLEVAEPRTPDGTHEEQRLTDAQPVELTDEQRAQAEQFVADFFEDLDTNRNGVVLRSELPISVREFSFDLFDLDGNGVATRDEVMQAAEQRLSQKKQTASRRSTVRVNRSKKVDVNQ